MRRLALLVVPGVAAAWLPGVAFAQGAPPPPPEPAPTSPAPEPVRPPEPGAPAPAPTPPPAQSYYQPQYQPVYQPQQPVSLHDGVTFEANLGLGWARTSVEGQGGDTSDLGVGGLSVGVGGWINPQIAVTGRIAGVTIPGAGDARASAIFAGPAIQYWVDNRFWLGGGLGLGLLAGQDQSGTQQDSIAGFGLDLRVGYTFNEGSEHTINASLELNPGFFSENNSSATVTGIGILLGYQYL